MGHLTEHGRVIGFVAMPQVISGCARIPCLGCMAYEIGILVRGDKAVLIDSDTARKCEEDVLTRELESLSDRLQDASVRGDGDIV